MPSCRPTGPAGRVELVVPFGDHVWQSASVVVAAVAWWLIDTFLHQRQQHQAAQEEEKRIRKRQPWQVVGVVVVLRLSRMVSASWNGVVCHLVIQNKKNNTTALRLSSWRFDYFFSWSTASDFPCESPIRPSTEKHMLEWSTSYMTMCGARTTRASSASLAWRAHASLLGQY